MSDPTSPNYFSASAITAFNAILYIISLISLLSSIFLVLLIHTSRKKNGFVLLVFYMNIYQSIFDLSFIIYLSNYNVKSLTFNLNSTQLQVYNFLNTFGIKGALLLSLLISCTFAFVIINRSPLLIEKYRKEIFAFSFTLSFIFALLVTVDYNSFLFACAVYDIIVLTANFLVIFGCLIGINRLSNNKSEIVTKRAFFVMATRALYYPLVQSIALVGFIAFTVERSSFYFDYNNGYPYIFYMLFWVINPTAGI